MNVKCFHNTKDFVIIMHFWQLSAAQHITHCWDHTQLTSDKHSEVIRISRVNISELEAAAGDQEIADLVRGDYTQPGGQVTSHKVLTGIPLFNLVSKKCTLILCLFYLPQQLS